VRTRDLTIAPMVVSRRQPASGQGIPCKSGTVPPL
jgi:hypothetical protein